jgi:GNAT superfamily N-acetyltransferase
VATLHIRRATLDDAPAVSDMAANLAFSYPFDPASFERSLPVLLAAGDTLLLVALIGADPAGYLLGHRYLTLYANGPVAVVDELLVRDGQRGHGIGRALMKAYEEWAAEHSCARVAVATRRAADFYRSCGYDDSALYLRKELLP